MVRSFFFLILLFTATHTFAEILPVEAFGRLPKIQQVKLSPNGEKIAFVRSVKGIKLIGVKNLKTRQTKYVIKTNNETFKIGRYVWANNDLLLVSTYYPEYKWGVKFTESRLMKVEADGSGIDNILRLIKGERASQHQNTIVDILPDEPDYILMSLDLKVANKPSVYKINLNDKTDRKIVYLGKRHIQRWLTDRQHRVRLGIGRDKTKIFYRLLDLNTQKWRNIWEYEIFDVPDVTPLGFGLNPNELYIRAIHEGRYAIFKVDLTQKSLPRTVVFADKDYDIEGSLIYSRKNHDVIGVYHGEAEDSKVFFESNYAAFQAALNTALPDAYNNIVSMSQDEQKYVLFSSSSTGPGIFYLGDKKKKSLNMLLDQYPILRNKELPNKNKIAYLARDGLTIEGYITFPEKNANSPKSKHKAALIIPHGGPMSRNYGGFDWFSAFFASRGYTILEPNFRGSSGYGFDFEVASIQQWGGAMQNDLADAAHWLVKEHGIAKDKICILGASYGGYAALMAAVKQQDTFKCSASYAAVSDLAYIVRKAKRFTNYKVVKKQIGDDSSKLEKNSPINFAQEINIPVMLIHGEDDRVVDVQHSRNMYEELLSQNKEVEYIELKNGNHHLSIEENRLKTLKSFETFLSKHLNAE